MGRLLDIISTLLCIGAGLYLLQVNSVGGNSWFDAIGHGMGFYFIGKGLFIARSTHLAAEQAHHLKDLVWLQGTAQAPGESDLLEEGSAADA